jgi:hypothetical protein
LSASSATSPPGATLAALVALAEDHDVEFGSDFHVPAGTVPVMDSHVFAADDSPVGTEAVDDQLLELLSGALGANR